MPKVKISEYSATANSNTDVASINIDEGCAPSGINNAIRAVMGHLKDFQQGTYGDPFNGPHNGTLGATTASTAVVTTLTTSSTVTHNGGTANGLAYLDGSKVLTTGSALVFDGSNLGVGVTPTGWSGLTAMQIGQAASIFAQSGGNFIGGYVGSNIYYNGGWKYIRNGYATKYDFNESNSGQHRWWIAPNNTSGAGAAATETQAMTLDASGGLKVLNTIGVGNATPSTSGAGITFPATQSASTDANTLDDYEEGTWTPSISAGVTSVTYATQAGTYTKIGNLVFASCAIRTTAGTTNGNDLTVSGLPFTASSASGSFGSGAVHYNSLITAGTGGICVTKETGNTSVKFNSFTGSTYLGTNTANGYLYFISVYQV